MSKIGLFLMGEKGFVVLQQIIKRRAQFIKSIPFVVSARDFSIKNDFFDEIKKLCIRSEINFFDRKEIEKNSLESDYALAISWRWLIHNFNFKLIVLHDSILPKYRGFNPLVTALIEGDKKIGVTAIEAEEDFDSGAIFEQEVTVIEYPIKIQRAIELISELYTDISIKLFDKIFENNLSKTKQDEDKTSYSVWRSDDDYRIDWNQNSDKIERFVNAVGYPYKGALTNYNGTDLRVKEVKSLPDLNIVNRKSGKILKIEENNPYVICGDGIIKIEDAVLNNKEDIRAEFDRLRVRLR